MEDVINNCMTGLNSAGGVFWDYAASMFVQSSILIIVLLIVDFLLRKHVRATFRYGVWMLVFVKLVLPPTLCLPTGIAYWCGDYLSADSPALQPASNIAQLESAETRTPQDFALPTEAPELRPSRSFPEMVAPVVAVAPVASSLEPITWQGVLFLVWLAGVLIISILLLQRVRFVRWLIAQSSSADSQLLDLLNESRRQLGIRRNIGLRLSSNTSSPAVCGLFKPIILMPTSLVKELSPDKLRAVFVHELAHIKRGDLWVNLAQTLLQIIYFYNPFVWLTNAVVRRIREQAVDEMALVSLGAEAKSYSNTLIDIAEMAFWRASFSLRLIGVVESKKALRRRIKHMLNRPMPKRARIGFVGALAVVIVGSVLLPMAKAKRNQKLLTGIDEKLKVTDKAGELTIDSLYMPSPNGSSLVGTNKVTLYVNVTNHSQKHIYLGLEYYTDSGTIAKVFSPGATSLAQIKKVPANWQGKLEYAIYYNRFAKGGYVKITLAKCAGEQDMKQKTLAFLPPGVEIIYEKKHNIVPVDDMQSDAGALTDSSFSAMLPNGVTIELVGVCEHPSEGKQWWRADGAMVRDDSRPYAFKELRILRLPSNQQENKILELAVKITDSSKRNVGIICSGAKRTFVSCGNNVWGGTVEVGKEPGVKDFKIGVAAGAWETLASSGSRFGGRRRKSPDIVFTEAYNTQEGYAVVIVTHKKDIQKENWRVVAIDEEGETHEADFYQTQGIGEFEQDMFHFKRLQSDQIGRFEFQTRPYQWVTFKNVSLRPGYKTDVQIEAETPDEKVGLVWGEAVNGLRAAVEFVPEKESYEQGEVVGIRFHLQNVSNQIINLATPRLWIRSRCFAEDQLGMKIPTRTVPEPWGMATIDRHRLLPGQVIKLESGSLAIAKDDTQGNSLCKYPVRNVVILKPGQYSLHYWLRFPGITRLDGDGKVIVPQPDDWQGALETGKRKLVLTSTAESDQQPAVQVEAETPDENVGLVWGKPVEGVQVRLRADKYTWEAEEKPIFKADIRNRGGLELSVFAADEFCQLEIDGQWYGWSGPWGKPNVERSLLGPGSQINDISISLAKKWIGKRNELTLTSGMHTVRVAFVLQRAERKYQDIVRAVSNPVEIEISPAERKPDVQVDGDGSGEEEVVWGRAVQGVQVAAWVERMKWHIEDDMPRIEEIKKWHIGGDVPRVNVEVRISDCKEFQESGLALKGMAHDWSAFALEIDGKQYKQNVFYTTEPGPLRSPFKIVMFLDDEWQGITNRGALQLTPGRHMIRVLFVGLGMRPSPASQPLEIEVLPDDKKLKPWPYPWGKAVGGVQVSAHPAEPSWPVGSEPVIKVRLRNQGESERPIHLRPSSFALEVDGKRYENNFIFHVWRRPFDAGDEYEFDLRLSKTKPFHDGLRKGNSWPPVGKPPPLLPGKHSIRVLFTELRIEPEPASQPVEFQIVAAASDVQTYVEDR